MPTEQVLPTIYEDHEKLAFISLIPPRDPKRPQSGSESHFDKEFNGLSHEIAKDWANAKHLMSAYESNSKNYSQDSKVYKWKDAPLIPKSLQSDFDQKFRHLSYKIARDWRRAERLMSAYENNSQHSEIYKRETRESVPKPLESFKIPLRSEKRVPEGNFVRHSSPPSFPERSQRRPLAIEGGKI